MTEEFQKYKNILGPGEGGVQVAVGERSKCFLVLSNRPKKQYFKLNIVGIFIINFARVII